MTPRTASLTDGSGPDLVACGLGGGRHEAEVVHDADELPSFGQTPARVRGRGAVDARHDAMALHGLEMSTQSQSKPRVAIASAAVGLPRFSQLPMDGWPARSFCLT